MNTVITKTKVNKALAPAIANSNSITTKATVYSGKTNTNWINKGAKKFGSKTKFIDAVITAARKAKLNINAPIIAKKATKKVSKKVLH